jgi:2-polyprenyl-6-hydroxyphenyl methylase/3-demethylubiquinone-9 3-methyltransferase
MGDKITFSFGRNWKHFLSTVTNEKLSIAKESIIDFTGKDDFTGKTVFDIGSGSGIFSFCMNSMGANKLVSIDVDPFSVECTKHMWENAKAPENWAVHEDSVLSNNLKDKYGTFDVVYSWGVLHHTGDMWKAISNSASLVNRGGLYYIAIYNGVTGVFGSKFWTKVKRWHNRSPFIGKYVLESSYMITFFISSLLKGRNPLKIIREYKQKRGMNWRRDVTDWVGGYPYESATIEEIFRYVNMNFPDFRLKNVKSTNGLGNNWFLFERD